MIFMETDRLILRNLTPADAAIMYDYRNNVLCSRYQRGQTKDLDGIIQLVESRKDDVVTTEHPFMVCVALKERNEMVGEIVVVPNDGAITLGYTFSYRHHRKGYAYEALKPFIEMLHNQFPEWEFICFTEPDNIASMALLRKLGYEDLGYAEKITSQVFGKWITTGV